MLRCGSARLNENFPQYTHPNYGTLDDAWTIVFDEQKGRAFHGVSISPKGTKDEFVGVVSFDGQHLLISTDDGGIFADMLGGGRMEFCFQDQQEHRELVSCYIVAKE
jgi:hypothetical protein